LAQADSKQPLRRRYLRLSPVSGLVSLFLARMARSSIMSARHIWLCAVSTLVLSLSFTGLVAAQDQPAVMAPDVIIPLPPAPDGLLVERERDIDTSLRALPFDSAVVTVDPEKDGIKPADPDIAVSDPVMPPLRGPLADRLFPDAPSSGMAAATPSTPPASVTSELAVDPQLALAMSEIIAGQKANKKIGRFELAEIAAVYSERGNAPIWHDDGDRNALANSVLDAIRRADLQGLDIGAYAAPRAEDASPLTIAAADVALTRAVIAYARDARGARIPVPAALSPMLTARPTLPGVRDVIATLLAAPDAAVALEGFNPQHPGYKALQAKLAAIRSGQDGEMPTGALVPVGKTLRLGQSDERVIALRQRLGVEPEGDELQFDVTLANAIKDFQRVSGIKATGIANQITVAALNGEPVNGTFNAQITEADLVANMERWRWLPAELGYHHVQVNIPEFRLEIVENGSVTHATRVIVGKPESQTPVFSDEIEFLVVNPTWTVPPSILLKEYLPKLRSNPYALKKIGLDVVRNGRSIDPGTVDWSDPSAVRRVAIRQQPGERNALGWLKIMFPNDHAVYLHDTPKRGLFNEEVRAFSHGCVRVENPFDLAQFVLGEGWPKERVQRLSGGKSERRITLTNHMAVHLMYFTVSGASQDALAKHRDIYGHDRLVRQALGI
jgi:L,D-transpeptidase YcbB